MKSNGGSTGGILSVNSFFDSLRVDKIVTLVDSNRIKIQNPRNSVVRIDSTINIQINVKDTSKLLYIELAFQNKHYRRYAVNPRMTFTVQATEQLIDTQYVYVRGYYDYGDSAKIVYDGIRIVVQPIGNPMSLKVAPNIVYLSKLQEYEPIYRVRFQNNTSEFGQNPDVNSTIANPSIMSFNRQTSSFKALDKGETFAVINYKGAIDTVYFVVSDTTNIRTGIEEQKQSDLTEGKTINLQALPNPFKDMITVQYELSQSSEVTINIVNLVGQTIVEKTQGQQAIGKHDLQIPVSTLQSGMYLLVVKTNLGDFSTKILKN